MDGRLTTGKKRAQRIDMQYFTRPHPLRSWRKILTIACVAAAVGLSTWGLLDRQVYSMGPVTSNHASFGENCSFCHEVKKATFREHVTDKSCLGCHDGPVHSGTQTFNPSCGSCHFEHRGVGLTEVRDVLCTTCHADLQVKALTPRIDRAVSRFDATHHPQFKALKGTRDPGGLRFNHAVHLDPTKLTEPMKARLGGAPRLQCNDCHRPESVIEPWLYGDPAFKLLAASLVARPADGKVKSSAHMEPVRFDRSCSSCHVLEFDALLHETVPHAKPEAVRTFLIGRYTDYARAHAAEILSGGAGAPDTPDGAAPAPGTDAAAERGRLPGRPAAAPAAPPASSPEAWVAARVAEAETTLYGITCRACHAIQSGDPLPTILPPSVPRWLPRARFDHQPHTMLQCESCHAAAASQSATDILVPGIENCITCHRPSGVDADCAKCHDYHDWSQAQRVKGKYKIEQLRGGRASAANAPSRAGS